MSQLTTDRIANAQGSLRWLATTHARIIKGLRDTGKGATVIAEAIDLHPVLVGNLLNSKAYLHTKGVEEAMRYARVPSAVYADWCKHAAHVPSSRWWQLLLYPKAIDVICKLQLYITGLDLKTGDWRSQEIIAAAIDPERMATVLHLLRFSREGLEACEKDAKLCSALLEGLDNVEAVRQRFRRYERHLSVLRRGIQDELRTLRVGSDGRSMTTEELARFAGYELNTVRVAFVNSPTSTANAYKVYTVLCEKQKRAVTLFLPTLPDAMLHEPADSAAGDEEATVSAPVDSAAIGSDMAAVPPANPSADEAVPEATPMVPSVPPSTDLSVERMRYKLALWRYLSLTLPQAWTEPVALAKAMAVGVTTERMLGDMVCALQGDVRMEGLVDEMVRYLVTRAHNERVPLPDDYLSTDGVPGVLLLQTGKRLLDILQSHQSLQSMDLSNRGHAEDDLLELLFAIYEAIEIFTAGNPKELAEVIAASKSMGQALAGKKA